MVLPELSEGSKAGTFYQVTVQADHRAKIRHTIRRLREFGREPKRLHYITSRTIPAIDQEQEELSEELDVAIIIRDKKWIVANINKAPETIAAFNSYLAPHVAFLREIGAPTYAGHLDSKSVRSLCVFLGQEVDRRRGNTQLLEAVTDSLILWSLEGTNPDEGKFLTRDQILAKIEETLPSAKHFIRGILNTRLEHLARKEGGELLAYNDAIQILRIYSKRAELKELHKPNPFGYRTWWLTHESRVRAATAKLVSKYNAQYIMRPEFALNFIALSPSAEKVRQSFGNIFPSLLGVSLSKRMKENVFHAVMGRIKEIQNVDEARARVILSDLSNKLKGDRYKEYDNAIFSNSIA